MEKIKLKTESWKPCTEEGNAKNDTKSLSDNQQQQLRLELRRRELTLAPFSTFRLELLGWLATNKRAQATEILAPFAASVAAISSATPTQLLRPHRRTVRTWNDMQMCMWQPSRGPGKQAATLAKNSFCNSSTCLPKKETILVTIYSYRQDNRAAIKFAHTKSISNL